MIEKLVEASMKRHINFKTKHKEHNEEEEEEHNKEEYEQAI